jgi:LPXTG-motif cell wall-anchored protein
MKKLTGGGGIVALIILVWAAVAQAHTLHGSCAGAFSDVSDSVFHSTSPPGITIGPGPASLVTWTAIGATSISGTFETGESGSASNTPCVDDTTTTVKATTTTAEATTTTAEATTTTAAAASTTAPTSTVPGSATTVAQETTSTTGPIPGTPVAAAPPAGPQPPAPAAPVAARTFLAPTGQTPASAEAGLPHTGARENITAALAAVVLLAGVALLLVSRRRPT